MKIERQMGLLLTALALVVGGLLLGTTAVQAHVHSVTTGSGREQELANGQNHPGFVNNVSCAGINELPGSGPAGYGLETAHHGPDSGDPGKDDGCYQRDTAPDDSNPAID